MTEIAQNHRPLKVDVMVTLERDELAGGHVKCWERFAEAAVALPEELDLTLHFLAERDGVERLAGNVRFRNHAAALGTRDLRFIRHGGGHTDLARFHRGLMHSLAGSDVVHATEFFSFGRTAIAYAERSGCGLVASIHTDVPRFTRVYAAEVIRRLAGKWGACFLNEYLRLPERISRFIDAGIDRCLARCDRVLVSKREDRDRLVPVLSPARISMLRRGIDRDGFSPVHRDRARLAHAFGIPPERPVLLFVGRIDSTKSALVMAEAAHRLLGEGVDLQVVAVGEGEDRGPIGELLGDRATLPGALPQKELAWLYASADLFVFPSMTEVSPNVVLEAKASGLPVVVAAQHGGGQFVARPGFDGVVLDSQDPSLWAEAITPLLRSPEARFAMSGHARRWAETAWPGWRDVLIEDLIPAWRKAAAKAA
ncbi:MAG TPA: glycosyltransferase [Hypericibacter adhaerens]|jgi:glycosyltransferase involved in cell wall biosynthesis|uniref:Glycosyl transferase n=1 Tax=Hypericibacter adhaerens TaxID=2602016 RepID=A0A5J6N3U8_9PROT|nr:glycosyltransferase [Hypericibacter adhaerens]QEX21576.1 glycosyl transferase [Hypericibacter adhaerens]HWA46517.1 glycosyltransferase [Hypericibacter adhaerens]